ncbi:MAG: PDC sensor domain-containing protein [Myxococcota bacterium]
MMHDCEKSNLVDDPQFPDNEMSDPYLQEVLKKLRLTSSAFVDIGVVDGKEPLVAYAGPVDFGEPVSYAKEPWFRRLSAHDGPLITDIYLGFRGQPHFTLAVKRPGSWSTPPSSHRWESWPRASPTKSTIRSPSSRRTSAC